MVTIGKLSKHLSILAPSRTENGFGEQLITYAVVGKVWASVEPLTAREINYAKQSQLSTTHKITMRYDATLRSDYRLAMGARTFHIVGLSNPGEANRELVISAVEVTSG